MPQPAPTLSKSQRKRLNRQKREAEAAQREAEAAQHEELDRQRREAVQRIEAAQRGFLKRKEHEAKVIAQAAKMGHAMYTDEQIAAGQVPLGGRAPLASQAPLVGQVAAPSTDEIEREIADAERPPPQRREEPAPDRDALEEARVAAHTRFQEAFDSICDDYWSGRPVTAQSTEWLISTMEFYRAIAGEYPYDESYSACPPAFTKYLEAEGLKPEIFEDVRRHVITAIANGDRAPYWDTLHRLLAASGREWDDTELFLDQIAPAGGARVLVEASRLGWADHRFEHAILTMQRLWRHRRANPLKDATKRREWFAEFERLHHVREPSWAAHEIHMRSFGETSRRFGPNDEPYEASFVRWNRKCIPELIAQYARTGGNFYDYELSGGVLMLLDPEGGGMVNLRGLVDGRRDALYRQNLEFLLNDDALTKTNILIRCLAEKSLDRPRNAARDVLKFVEFTLNEPPPQWVQTVRIDGKGTHFETAFTERRLARDTPIAKCYLDRLDKLPIHELASVFRVLPGCLATHGRDLLYRFSQVNVAALAPPELAQWFLDITIDDLESVCEGSAVRPEALGKHLRDGTLDRDEAAQALLRAHLESAQKLVVSGQRLYDYTIWIEPVKVNPVILPTFREAAVGRIAVQ